MSDSWHSFRLKVKYANEGGSFMLDETVYFIVNNRELKNTE
jgi:hypothetical protein